MSFCGSIWALNKREQRRIAAGLLALRRQLASEEEGTPSFAAAARKTESINAVKGFPMPSRKRRNWSGVMKGSI